MMKCKIPRNIQIGKSHYESPSVDRSEIQTEGSFAASQSVSENSQNNVTLDSWTKVTDSDTDIWSDP